MNTPRDCYGREIDTMIHNPPPATNTPDTEFDSDKEVVGSDCLCVLGSKKHNPECEYATPDTEWENEFDEKFSEFRYENVPDDMDVPIVYVKDFIRNLRTRHDTYWKERVEDERKRCIKVVEDYGERMEKHQSRMIGTAHDDCKEMLSFDLHSRRIAITHILKALGITNEDNLK